MRVELQRLVRDFAWKKPRISSGAFFAFYGCFSWVFWKMLMVKRGVFVVKVWWNAW